MHNSANTLTEHPLAVGRSAQLPSRPCKFPRILKSTVRLSESLAAIT
jgi:hypothetical protein